MDSAADIEREGNWAASLVSWGGLVVAGSLFSLATLAPRLADLQVLRSRYAENQQRLVGLESQADELSRVADALRTDPQFLTELAKLEFAGARRDAESIPVDPELRLGETRSTNRLTERSSIGADEWIRAWLTWFADRPRLRAALLTIAAVIGLVSLIGVRQQQLAVVGTAFQAVRDALAQFLARYRRA